MDHVEIAVRDFKTSVEFWEKLGFRVMKVYERDGKPTQYFMQSDGGKGDVNLDLVHRPQQNQDTYIDHIAWRVEDVEKTYEELKKIPGIKIVREPYMSPPSGRKLLIWEDIDGIKHHLTDYVLQKEELKK